MHFAKTNSKCKYKIDDVVLEEVIVEKDLGVFISNNMDWSYHINYLINKANKQLGRIKHAFEYIDEYIISLLYNSLIRPHLEYGAVVWSPHRQGEIDKLEKVQHRATKISSLVGLNQGEINIKLKSPCLEDRRI